MKRTTIISILAVASLLAVSCKEEQCDWEAYDGNGSNPCLEGEEVPCEDYPPEDVTISWDDYNTVTELRNYFECHRKAQEEHRGDTLKFVGWLDESGGIGENYETNDYMMYWFIVTDDPSHLPDEYNGFYVFQDEQLDITPLRGKKLFITGLFDPFDRGDGGCCSMTPGIKISSIDFE